MRKNKKANGIEAIRRRYAYTFVGHWMLGLVLFLIVPIFSSIIYSFSSVAIKTGGVETKFVGFSNFEKIINSNASYLDNMRNSVGTILYSLPIILALSLILAIILNQKFFGRTVARAIFFLPIIIVSSALLKILNNPQICEPLFTSVSSTDSTYGSMIDFKSILSSWDMPPQISNFISKNLGNVFNLIWNCGVQTILFLAGLQSIPDSLYEVSKIEGANKWEEFWFITIPMIRHVISLVIIYTTIDQFTASTNPVMSQAMGLMKNMQVYDETSAMLWLYFILVISILLIIIGVYNKICIKKWD